MEAVTEMKRRDFMKLAAGAALFNIGTLRAAPLAKRIAQGAKIRVALIGCGGRMQTIVEPLMAEDVVALADPDPRMIERTKAKMARMPNAGDISKVRTFADYRELFAKMGDEIDAVAIATPNHHHALAAVLAMRHGIHVFVEKPMASTVAEAQLMGRVAKEMGVVTQVGNFGHSTKAMRICVDAITPNEDHDGLHPHDWHSWIGYGNGSIGNMGTHIMDAAFWALELGKTGPESVEALDVQFACPGAWAWRDTIDFRFPARGDLPPVTLHWWDGVKDGIPYSKKYVGRTGVCHKREYQNLPPIIEETEREYGLEKAPFLNMGSLFVGTKGKIWFSHHSAIRFFPKTLGVEIKKSKKFTYKTTEHTLEFYAAIREGRQANTGFGYSVPLAETLLLGNVAARAGKKKLLWDGRRITNDEAANAFLKTSYRPGWELS